MPSTPILHPPCGKTWTGLRAEHCAACHETFSGTRAGDAHRTGPHAARRCLSPEDAGLVRNPETGVWRLPPSGRAPWS